MTFISRVIYDIISLEKNKDVWLNFDCAEKIHNINVDQLEVII